MPVPHERLLAQLENSHSLLEPDRVRERLDVLDQLDASFPQGGVASSPELDARAHALRMRLEAMNLALYEFVRGEIREGTCPAIFARELASSAAKPTGNHYDHLDELLAGVFAIPEPAAAEAPTHAEQVFYQPTPARHIFELIRQTHLTAADTLIDLGSGLGHVPLVVSVCTGARAIGIEIEAAYVASARQCAEALHLEKVQFLAQDARAADFSRGTVFYLYTPYTGSILRSVLDRLRTEAAAREIRIVTFGPCVQTLAREEWLISETTAAEDRITIFRARKEARS